MNCESRLTLPLDLEHADGVLRRQVPELAGRQRVSPLPQRADGRLQEEGLEEGRVTDLVSHDDALLLFVVLKLEMEMEMDRTVLLSVCCAALQWRRLCRLELGALRPAAPTGVFLLRAGPA